MAERNDDYFHKDNEGKKQGSSAHNTPLPDLPALPATEKMNLKKDIPVMEWFANKDVSPSEKDEKIFKERTYAFTDEAEMIANNPMEHLRRTKTLREYDPSMADYLSSPRVETTLERIRERYEVGQDPVRPIVLQEILTSEIDDLEEKFSKPEWLQQKKAYETALEFINSGKSRPTEEIVVSIASKTDKGYKAVIGRIEETAPYYVLPNNREQLESSMDQINTSEAAKTKLKDLKETAIKIITGEDISGEEKKELISHLENHRERWDIRADEMEIKASNMLDKERQKEELNEAELEEAKAAFHENIFAKLIDQVKDCTTIEDKEKAFQVKSIHFHEKEMQNYEKEKQEHYEANVVSEQSRINDAFQLKEFPLNEAIEKLLPADNKTAKRRFFKGIKKSKSFRNRLEQFNPQNPPKDVPSEGTLN